MTTASRSGKIVTGSKVKIKGRADITYDVGEVYNNIVVLYLHDKKVGEFTQKQLLVL